MGFGTCVEYRQLIPVTFISLSVREKSTHEKGNMTPDKPMQMVYDYFKLDSNTTDFIGHAVALHRDDSYKTRPCEETIMKCQLYADSVAR